MNDTTTNPIFRNTLSEDIQIRKELFIQIEKELGGKIISYIENSNHPLAGIRAQNIIHFEDLLRSTGNSNNGFLLINSLGGNSDVVEKLLRMCRERFDNFTVIVPNFAKSAATMLCLGADKIMMGYLAELGPIDPQISESPGQPFLPARSFIDGLNLIRQNVKSGDPPVMYYPMLQKIRPEIIPICESALTDAQQFAEKWLSNYMLKDNKEQAKKVSEWLSDGKTYKSHGKVIDYYEVKDRLKLNAEKIDPKTKLWSMIWELYVRSMLYVKHHKHIIALFENSQIALNTNSSQ